MKKALVLCFSLVVAVLLSGKVEAADFDSFIQQNIGSSTSNQQLSGQLDSYINQTLRQRGNQAGTTRTTSNNGNIALPYGGPVFNGPGLEGGANVVEQYLDDGVSKERDIKELIIGWTNFLLAVTAVIAVVALVWAGIVYITSLGDDSRMESAKKIIIWCIIGILVILASYAIVNTVMQAAF